MDTKDLLKKGVYIDLIDSRRSYVILREHAEYNGIAKDMRWLPFLYPNNLEHYYEAIGYIQRFYK